MTLPKQSSRPHSQKMLSEFRDWSSVTPEALLKPFRASKNRTTFHWARSSRRPSTPTDVATADKVLRIFRRKTERTGRGFGGHPRLDELWFSLYDEIADDLEERPADSGYA